jgi:hypothetical protein
MLQRMRQAAGKRVQGQIEALGVDGDQ